MKETESFFKIVSDGLKTLAHSVETLAGKVDDIAHAVTAPKPKKRTQARPAKAPKPPALKGRPRAVALKAPVPTATDKAYTIIERSKQGVDTKTIVEQTGLTRHQASNIVYRLKKAGKIKRPRKGIYLQNRP